MSTIMYILDRVMWVVTWAGVFTMYMVCISDITTDTMKLVAGCTMIIFAEMKIIERKL